MKPVTDGRAPFWQVEGLLLILLLVGGLLVLFSSCMMKEKVECAPEMEEVQEQKAELEKARALYQKSPVRIYRYNYYQKVKMAASTLDQYTGCIGEEEVAQEHYRIWANYYEDLGAAALLP